MHFQQFVQFVKCFGSFNHVRSSTTPLWGVKAKEGPALPRQRELGQHWAEPQETLHCEEPSENPVIKASFIFEAVHVKDSLAGIAEGVKHTKPPLQLLPGVQMKPPQSTGQRGLLFCTDLPCENQSLSSHVSLHIFAWTDLKVFLPCDVLKPLPLMWVKYFFQ